MATLDETAARLAPRVPEPAHLRSGRREQAMLVITDPAGQPASHREAQALAA